MIIERIKKMKNNKKTLLSFVLALALVLSMSACSVHSVETEAPKTATSLQHSSDSEQVAAEGTWANALYRSDKSFGDGAKIIQVEVKSEDKSITFTIKTDKDTLGDALLEHGLVEGEQGAYGLYIKKVDRKSVV